MKRRDAKIILVVGDIVDNNDFEAIKEGYERKNLAKLRSFWQIEYRLKCIIEEMDTYGRLSCDLLSTLIAQIGLKLKLH